MSRFSVYKRTKWR